MKRTLYILPTGILIAASCFFAKSEPKSSAIQTQVAKSNTEVTLPERRLVESTISESDPIPESPAETTEEHLKLHPLVKFANPERITSFNDKGVEEALSVYFSLIGEAVEDYPYHLSGFDSQPNAELAFETLSTIDYSHPMSRDQAAALILAMSHLTHSKLPSSESYIRDLIHSHIQTIEKGVSKREASLRAADLSDLLTKIAPTDLRAMFHETKAAIAKGVIYDELVKRLSRGRVSEKEVEAKLASEGIQASTQWALYDGSKQ